MSVSNRKSLGQHWLKNRSILNQIARLSVSPGVDTCLEIGPGLGTLTSSLFQHFSKIIAVEVDSRLATNLPLSFPGKTLTVINQDILTTPLPIQEKYVIAGNIPYYITSPIIRKFLTITPRPQKIVLLIQKEVAERIADFEKSSLLSLFTQNRAEVKLGPIVPKAEFTPPPQVDSRVLILNPHHPIIPDAVFSLIKLGFHSPRKKLITNLAHLQEKAKIRQILLSLQLSPDARPSDLRLQDWQALYQALTPSIS